MVYFGFVTMQLTKMQVTHCMPQAFTFPSIVPWSARLTWNGYLINESSSAKKEQWLLHLLIRTAQGRCLFN